MKDCIEDVSEWMSISKLKTNDDTTELTGISTELRLSQASPNISVSISG